MHHRGATLLPRSDRRTGALGCDSILTERSRGIEHGYGQRDSGVKGLRARLVDGTQMARHLIPIEPAVVGGSGHVRTGFARVRARGVSRAVAPTTFLHPRD